MAIQILSPQLANQIAAGEVVERPASVVKELVENSLDAGATRIQIDIERGGAKRIAIRDNGCGINKQELALALARHATSKIHTLDDLESIMSLGFRGEALASISSVSRLTLTSRTAEQSEAWQAYAEGREMEVEVRPAAHPCGTTLEVLDLFYNTPARRKFMRTEKTEFTHIDEVIRRIALVRFDVDFTLTHNGKLVRQYRAAKEKAQQERRLAAICGSQFLHHALHLDWQHQGLSLAGWVATPGGVKSSTDLQYCYVNGRMMRDKLISHAIRQAYQDKLGGEQQPAYVLYLELSPQQVDVNVHPAKHEVRFHQARLVHDFLYQGVLSVLQAEETTVAASEPQLSPSATQNGNRAAAGKNLFAPDASAPLAVTKAATTVGSAWQNPKQSGTSAARGAGSAQGTSVSYRRHEGKIYQQMMRAAEPTPASQSQQPTYSASSDSAQETPLTPHAQSFGRVLTVLQSRFAVVESAQGLAAVSLVEAAKQLVESQLRPQEQALKSQPLLIPLRLKATPEDQQVITGWKSTFYRLGIEIQFEVGYLILKGVPLPLRSQNLQILIPQMLAFCGQNQENSEGRLAHWLARQHASGNDEWNSSQAITLLAELERMMPALVVERPPQLFQSIDLDAIFEKLAYE